MSPKDIVKATIRGESPSELPFLMLLDGIRLELKNTEYRKAVYEMVKNRYSKHIVQLTPNGEELPCYTLDWPDDDEWWRAQMYGHKYGAVWPIGGFVFRLLRPVYHPLEKSFDADKIEFPDPEDPVYLKNAEKIKKKNEDKYLLGQVWFTLFEKMHLTAGYENVMMGPHLFKDKFLKLRDKVMEFNLKAIKRWTDLGVDGIFFSDDWGTQDRLQISPSDWREYYKPCYKILFDAAHKGGADAWLHSCGHVEPIIGELIEIGLDVLHPIQPNAVDPKRIAKEYGGKICFCGGLDTQKTIPFGSPKEIEREFMEVFNLLGAPYKGKYIPGPGNTIIEDTPLENVKAIYETLDKINENLPWRTV